MAVVEDAARRAPQTVSEATHDLYRQYGKQIYAYCLHQLRSREEAEDAVQTTFLNAFRGLQRGTTTRFEQAWLYKIAQNVCIARRSSTGRRLRLESPDDFEILQEVVPSASAPEGDTLELMGLDAALDSMPENQRRAILMREWQGMSYREIATELGLTQGAVEMLIFRARRTLAHALEQPVAEKRAGKARTGFSLGSLIAALKPLFSTGAAVKMAAVAVSAAVVGTNGVVNSVISRTASPAKKRAVAIAPVRVGSVPAAAGTAAPAEPVEPHRVVAATPAASHQTPSPTRRPAIPDEVDVAAPSDPAPPVAQTPAPEQTASQTAAPPQHVDAAPQQTAPAVSAPGLSTPAPATPPPATPASQPHDPGPPPAVPTQSQTATPPKEQTKDARGGKHHVEKTWSTWDLPRQSSDDTTTTVATTTTTTTPTAPTTTPTTTTPTATTPVSPGPVAAPVTTTSTPPVDPPVAQQSQPTTPPPTVSIPRGDGHGNGDHDGWGNGGGGGHHGHH